METTDRKSAIWITLLFETVILIQLAVNGLNYISQPTNNVLAEGGQMQQILPFVPVRINDTIYYDYNDWDAFTCSGIYDCAESICEMSITYRNITPYTGIFLPALVESTSYTINDCGPGWKPIDFAKLWKPPALAAATVFWFFAIILLIGKFGISIISIRKDDKSLCHYWFRCGIFQNIFTLISFILVNSLKKSDSIWFVPPVSAAMGYIFIATLILILVWYIWIWWKIEVAQWLRNRRGYLSLP